MELKLDHIYLNGYWYWQCPVCDELLCKHESGKGKGHQVLQSKGTATKHLISHNAGYTPKRIPIQEITSRNQYFCNKCGDSVVSKTEFEQRGWVSITRPIWKPQHRFMCYNCSDYTDFNKGMKTKDEVHKGIIK